MGISLGVDKNLGTGVGLNKICTNGPSLLLYMQFRARSRVTVLS